MKQYWFLPLKWQNFYIGKDVCQIPLQIKNEFGYDTTLVFIGKSFDDELVPKEFYGMKIIIINNYFRMILFFLKELNKIDLFGTFHFQKYSLFIIILYKILKPKGKVILKSDISHNSVLQLIKYNKNKIKGLIITFILCKIDFFTVESKENIVLLINNFSNLKNKFIFVSNGFDDYKVPLIDIDERENNIIVIGHIGDFNKNHNLLIESIKGIVFNEKWRLYFIGMVFNDFDKFQNKQNFKNIEIVFTGPIYDKVNLYNILNKSKIFCHTSNSEGDPLVQYEAMYYGLYCVSTDCGTIRENYPDFFSKISKIGDINEYKENLQYVINYFEEGNSKDVKKNFLECNKYCIDKFLWNKTSLKLIEALKGKK